MQFFGTVFMWYFSVISAICGVLIIFIGLIMIIIIKCTPSVIIITPILLHLFSVLATLIYGSLKLLESFVSFRMHIFIGMQFNCYIFIIFACIFFLHIKQSLNKYVLGCSDKFHNQENMLKRQVSYLFGLRFQII